MKVHTKARTVATVLMLDAAIHSYWATGAVWPAHSLTSLSLAVLNADVRWNAPVLLPIAGMLVTGATALLARSHGRGGQLAALGSFAVAAGLGMRGVAGLVWISGVGSDPQAPFYWLNLLLYTPACMTLAPLALSVVTGPRAAGIGRLRSLRRALS
ncbi:DUF3995 domain-containing protein [Streptacidiphilus jiangxiensis]|uniref:4,5:9,10-diseco-3-hydroxy-5,9,17-trioxoandrosta-1(10),2-diene-4-oate hydrolase n=1 Tax=Streptacidiphilus jiangxiensis TaxID=235985 RepID=A0A1H7TP22_STRJI|nr:DUF3995 domain-containing protein [Streptacidiphilus jiangxiensis]SEL86204.1 4,5:9,10-diseco-3-hydroxy-5,9,17-trioxoandrosta-1(10),2-diene-4-oate hydrolase [Streptacidiphilus jiangxiensis]